ncbi:heparinase II/III family protein [Tautonia marina]|uniref:heparinase II/III family protein n=1 Tax=Tautonia marina TaxID=2653855 RepID=UPI0012608789|nr:heparinase II/III family protein [Tautonia marina]
MTFQPPQRRGPNSISARSVRGLVVLTGLILPGICQGQSAPSIPKHDPFAFFALPTAWQDEFWADPDVEALLALEPKAVADLVPKQAGLYYVRCPSCDAVETGETFSWSVQSPEALTCRTCEATFPNDAIPAKVNNAVPSQAVEVLHGVTHQYPYHLVEATKARYPQERIYLDAKRDDLARTFLARFALYAAVRHRDALPDERDPKMVTLAAVILLRFAQVYPEYAVHFDHPSQPKYFQPANLKPPYREGFRSAKWDRSGALNVPMNLVIAYAILRDDPAIDEAGTLLDEPDPGRAIEEDLLRASAQFLLGHPDPHDEQSIYAARGLLAVGHLLEDSALKEAGLRTLDALARRGFYHDGHWKSADPEAHCRVVGLIDGWFQGLVPELGSVGVPEAVGSLDGAIGAEPIDLAAARDDDRPGASLAAVIPLARKAGDAALLDPNVEQVQQVSWPATPLREPTRAPTLLGGAGLARLSAGEGESAIDLELRGFADYGEARYDRLGLRLAFGGQTVLGDLDDYGPTPSGWERSSAAHNLVIVDGLNQRESPAEARIPVPGSDILFFAAEPDLQVVTMSDRRAYPSSSSRYRHTLAVVHDEHVRFAVGVFEVHGGHQHDAIFHAPPNSSARWRTLQPLEPGPKTLLPASIVYVPDARVEDGRWFLQAFGAFSALQQGRVEGPTLAELHGPSGPLVRLHLLNTGTAALYTGLAPDRSEEDRGVLILRKSSSDEEELKSSFVTLYEPAEHSGIRRVGRVESPEGTILLVLETVTGLEYLLFNTSPGSARSIRLTDGKVLNTDGLLVRVRSEGVTLVGGTFAEYEGHRAEQQRVEGRIRAVVRSSGPEGPGWFETEGPLTDPERLAGRTLIISHGGEAARAWTIDHAKNGPDRRARIVVREEPGFLIHPETGAAEYYQFPNGSLRGPHRFIVPRIARSAGSGSSR